MWYTMMVVHEVPNAAIELDRSTYESSWARTLEDIGKFDCIFQSKKDKSIIIRKPKCLKAVMFCDSNYATYKETRNRVSDLVTIPGGTLLPCSYVLGTPCTLNTG